MLKTKNYKLKTERGVSLYMVFMIMALLLGIGFGMSSLLLSQLDTLRGIGYSVLAFYATEAGIDRVLYIDQKTCANQSDRVGCLHTAVDPLGTQTLSNWAQYTLTIESPGGACTASTYCAKSVGTYQQARRAVRVAR
jgi:hypothetical protein